MTNPVILTGLRANNDLTLGNYFGGMLPIIDMARQKSSDYQINMFIPDLHSFTTPIDHTALYRQVLDTAKLFVAAGLPLDNGDIHLYRQSYVPAHSELTWILDNFTGFGQLGRMTQFKDKSKSLADPSELDDFQEELVFQTNKLISVGLFNYPVLMASDILLYGAKYVPVGDDQTQHLEFTRDIGERMNTRFGELFVVPEPVKKQHEFFSKNEGLRIKDLQDPSKKMSKSDASGKGVIFLSDSPDLAAKKIMSAATDDKAQVRYNVETQPGISNLLEILALLRNDTVVNTAKKFEHETRYGEFKKIVAAEVADFLNAFQQKVAAVDESAVLEKLVASEITMNRQANATLLRVQKAVGLRPNEA